MSTNNSLEIEIHLETLQKRGMRSIWVFLGSFLIFGILGLFNPDSNQTLNGTAVVALALAYFAWGIYWTIVGGVRGRGILLLLFVIFAAPVMAFNNWRKIQQLKKQQATVMPANIPQASANSTATTSMETVAKANQTPVASTPKPQVSKANSETKLQQAYDLLKAKQIKEGAKLVESILQENPDNVKALLLMGHVMRSQNKPDLARAYYIKAARLGSPKAKHFLDKFDNHE